MRSSYYRDMSGLTIPASKGLAWVGLIGVGTMSRRGFPSVAYTSVISLALSALLAYSDSASSGPAPARAAEGAGGFRIWKTITLGTYGDVNLLLEDLDSPHCGVDNSAHARRDQAAFVPGTTTPKPCTLGESAGQIIGRPGFTLNKTKVAVDLVVLSMPDLHFEGERASVADIYARAMQFGLELCSAEVGPQLRLQYLSQPVGEFLRIAMRPIPSYGGDLIAFTVANGGTSLSLIGGEAHAGVIVHASARFVFVRHARIAEPAGR
jgi:hypothetical protein